MRNIFNRIICLILIFSTLLGSVLPTCVFADEIPAGEFVQCKIKNGESLGVIGFSAPIYMQEGNNNINGQIKKWEQDTFWIGVRSTGEIGSERHKEWYVYNLKNVDSLENMSVYFKKEDFYDENGEIKLEYLHFDDDGKLPLRLDGEYVDLPDGKKIYGKKATDLFESVDVKTLVVDIGTKPLTIFEKLEVIFADMVTFTANSLIKLINLAVGGKDGVTIDDIIFNHYEPTKLLYFDGLDSGEPNESGQVSLAYQMKKTINKWANIFTEIALSVYLAALLYIGIQILLRTNGKRRADYQRLLWDWLVGLCLLFFFPLIAKVSLEANDAFVAEIETSKSEAAQNASRVTVKTGGLLTLDSNADASDKIAFGENWDAAPFESTSNNYMVKMQTKAQDNHKLSYAIVYLIMAWQLLMIVIVYYKRVFMVGFLLVLFPLVAMTYAIDKVKDGKSQAFDRWAKEIIVNIFLQTFHAIIYVFAVNVSYVGGEQGDWLLMIIGVSFLFKGEEIIKNLFGQKAESAPTLSQSAAITFATYGAVKGGVKKLTDNFIGKNSHLGKAITANRNARTYEMMANNLDALASTGMESNKGSTPQYSIPSASALPHAPANMDDDATQLGNDIQTINHRNNVSPEALAQAIDRVQNYHGSHGDMLRDLNVDIGRLRGMQTIKERVLNKMANGTDKATIEQDIRLELESLFGMDGADAMERALYHQMSLPLNSNHATRNTDWNAVQFELEAAKKRRQELEESFKFSPTGSTGRRLERETDDILFDIYGRNSGLDLSAFEMAKSVAIMKNRGSGRFNARQQMRAMNYILYHKGDSEEFSRMARSLNFDVDEMNEVLADKIMKEYVGEDYRDNPDAPVNTEIPDGLEMRKVHQEQYEKRIEDAVELAKETLQYYEGEGKVSDLDKISVNTIINNDIDDGKLKPKTGEELRKDRNSGRKIVGQNIIDGEQGGDVELGENDVQPKQNNSKPVHTPTNTHFDTQEKPKHDEEVRRETPPADETLPEYDSSNNKEVEEDIIRDTINRRVEANRREAEMLRKFAEGHETDNTPSAPVEQHREATLNGYTKEDLYALADEQRREVRVNAVRSVAETAGAVAVAPIGAAAGIAFAETNKGGPIAEGIAGAFGGAVVGDQAVSGIIGGEKEKEFMMRNPYTGEDEKVTLKVGGLLSEKISSYYDPELPDDVRLSIRKQFIETAAKKRRKEEEERQKQIKKENKRNS